MISAKDLKIGDHVIFNDDYLNRNEELLVRFIDKDFCGLSHIGEKSCFISYYKDNKIKNIV
jgi:hypothetical protein